MLRRDLEQLLRRAERSIALLERCRPLDYELKRESLVERLRAGDPIEPRFEYARDVRLGQLADGLAVVQERVDPSDGWSLLYAERTRELELEARIAQEAGRPKMREAAKQRFAPAGRSEAEAALRLARAWAALPEPPRGAETFPSDDPGEPASLLCQIRRAVGRHKLAFRVEVSPSLTSAAATGDGIIVIKSGLRLSARAAQRVAQHEVLGHALPRHNARHEAVGLFRVGSAGGPDEEEGRAILIEERLGLCTDDRRRELGLRHLAAASAHEGADWVDSARMLVELGATCEQAVSLASRVHRGGGLGREIVYLEALLRVRRAFEAAPESERALERGRVSVAAGRRIDRLGSVPDELRTIRAA